MAPRMLLDREETGRVIGLLWERGRYDVALQYIDVLMNLYPKDHYPYRLLVQTELNRNLAGGRNDLTDQEAERLIKFLETGISLIDMKEVANSHALLNEAAFLHTILATVCQFRSKTRAINKKMRKAAEWVIKREFPQSPEYHIEPLIMAEAAIRLTIALERLGNDDDRHTLQSALVTAISNYRRAGDELNMKKALAIHVQIFGYEPLNLSNLEGELPRYVEAVLGRQSE